MVPCLKAETVSCQTGGYGGTPCAMLTSRFAFPAGPLRGASSALPSAAVVSSDSCGAQPRPLQTKASAPNIDIFCSQREFLRVS